ncbi:MAG: DUF1552 domain-containing protein [Vicinamibacterales bacterium]
MIRSAAFVRLFGDGAGVDNATRRARVQRGSILDSLLTEVARLRESVAAPDRTKINGYLDSIRDVEVRIQKALAYNAEMPSFTRPAGVPEVADHAKLMFDLQLLAFQGDDAREVSCSMIGREFSGRTYPEIGVPTRIIPSRTTSAIRSAWTSARRSTAITRGFPSPTT